MRFFGRRGVPHPRSAPPRAPESRQNPRMISIVIVRSPPSSPGPKPSKPAPFLAPARISAQPGQWHTCVFRTPPPFPSTPADLLSSTPDDLAVCRPRLVCVRASVLAIGLVRFAGQAACASILRPSSLVIHLSPVRALTGTRPRCRAHSRSRGTRSCTRHRDAELWPCADTRSRLLSTSRPSVQLRADSSRPLASSRMTGIRVHVYRRARRRPTRGHTLGTWPRRISIGPAAGSLD